MNDNNFTPEEMESLGEVLRSAYLATISNMGADLQEAATLFWQEHLLTCKPYMAVTPAGITHYIKTVFGSEDTRDFVMQLTSNFFMLWGAGREKRLALATLMGECMSTEMGVDPTKHQEYVGIPDAAWSRMSEKNDAVKVLSANGWLLVLLLAPTYMAHKDFAAAPAKNKGRPS